MNIEVSYAAHDRDLRVRLATFKWLEDETRRHGEVLPWKLLADGFTCDGRRIPVVGQQGIFKPAALGDLPLSLRTSAEGPYDDSFASDDTLLYRYRGDDPNHYQNVWVRNAMTRRTPLVYCHGVVPGRYLTVWPVFVVGDDPGALTFSVAADERRLLRPAAAASWAASAVSYSAEVELRRRYVTREVRQRLHQSGFRERVLRAYREQCALCRLRHPELLEAAHITPDTDLTSDPVVSNGLSLCRLHHGAFDHLLIGIRPDCTVEVRPSILQETDGPMLRHGLQGVNGQRIWTPRGKDEQPDPDRLEERYRLFKQAS